MRERESAGRPAGIERWESFDGSGFTTEDLHTTGPVSGGSHTNKRWDENFTYWRGTYSTARAQGTGRSLPEHDTNYRYLAIRLDSGPYSDKMLTHDQMCPLVDREPAWVGLGRGWTVILIHYMLLYTCICRNVHVYTFTLNIQPATLYYL